MRNNPLRDKAKAPTHGTGEFLSLGKQQAAGSEIAEAQTQTARDLGDSLHDPYSIMRFRAGRVALSVNMLSMKETLEGKGEGGMK